MTELCITGTLTGSNANFDPAGGSAGIKSGAGYYVAKYDSSGSFIWAITGTGIPVTISMPNSYGSSLALDKAGNIWVAGQIYSEKKEDFDPGPDSAILAASNGGNGAYIAKYDKGGNYLWAGSIDCPRRVYAANCAVDLAGNLFVAGSYNGEGGPADFDPGPDTAYLYAKGENDDYYILKLGCYPDTSTIINAEVTCGDPYFMGRDALTESGIYRFTFINRMGCDSVVTINLKSWPVEWHYNTIATEICWSKDSILIEPHILSGDKYIWDNNVTDKERYIDRSGIYWVDYIKIKDSICNKYLDSFIINDISMTEYVTSDSIEACWADTVLLSAKNQQINTTYVWNNGDKGLHKNVTRSGTYWVRYYTDTPCVRYIDTFHVFIPQQDFKVRFMADTFLCQGQPVSLRNASGDYYESFLWLFGNGDSSTQRNPDYTYNTPGSYDITLTGNYKNLCYDTSYQTVIVDPHIAVYFRTEPDVICAGEQICIHHNISDTSVLYLRWAYGDGITAALADPIVQYSYDREGEMVVELEAGFRACPTSYYTDTVYVHSIPKVSLGKDSGLCLQGTPVTLQNHHPHEEGSSYLWNTGETTPSVLIKQPGDYWLQVWNGFGCSSTETVTIHKDCTIDIPNAFTPNGDGSNDYFFPRQLLSRNVQRFTMQIYNRWGQLLFERHNVNGRGWDGKLNGREQPEGVYIYTLDIVFTNGKAENYKGNIALIR